MGMWRRVFVGILLWACVEGVTLQASLFGVFAGSIIDTHTGASLQAILQVYIEGSSCGICYRHLYTSDNRLFSRLG